MQFILGPRNSALIALILEAIILAGLFYGYYLIRVKRDRAAHEKNQTLWVMVNLALIFGVMVIGFYRYVILGGAANPQTAQMMVGHAISGTLAQLMGIYIILRMKGKIPERFRIKNYKLFMRVLLALWTVQALGGFGIYFAQYVQASAATAAPSNIARLQNAANDLVIHADELATAAKRGNLATTKRHAEHLVNLIAGKNSSDYGDADKDGFIEDPGDGSGAITLLKTVREEAAKAGGKGADAAGVADKVNDAMVRSLASSKTILQVADVKAAQAQIDEILKLTEEINRSKEKGVPQIATLLGVSAAMPAVVPETDAVTINIKDFVYAPKTLTVKRGTTITWVNLDQAKHTVSGDTRAQFDSRDMPSGKSFSFTFSAPGAYPYYCEYHGDKGGVDMAATVIVLE